MMILPRKLWALLTTSERWWVAGLFAMVALMGLAQMAGVGAIAPFVSVLVDPESAHTNQWLRLAFDGLGFTSVDSFLLFLALVVLAAVILANSCLALTQWMLIRFGAGLQYRLSCRLLEAYLARPYVVSVQRNSADSAENVLIEAERLAGVVLSLLRTIAFSVAGLLILAALFMANALMTFAVIAVLGGGYGITYLAVRRVLGRVGVRRMRASIARFKTLNEAFGGLKETKVLGREAAFLSRYASPAKQFAEARVTEQVTEQMPRYAMEVLAAGLLVMIALFFMGALDGAIQSVAPLLAMYALAALRLLPFLAQVYHGGSEFRVNAVVVDSIYDDMVGNTHSGYPALNVEATGDRLPFQHELRLEGVTFSYPSAERPAVQNITLVIPHRAFVGIVGATGAGKTSLVDIILGLLEPDEGILTVDGVRLDRAVVRAWQNNLGYVPQDIYLTDDSIAGNIAFGIPPEERRREMIESAARIANIHDFIVDELPNGYDTIVGERGVRLSGGERQRVGIARALYHDPAVLVLDEATSNLDQGTEAAVHKAIEQAAAAKTVIMIAHRLSVARHCDILYLLDHGSLVAQGAYDTLLGGSERFRAMAEAR